MKSYHSTLFLALALVSCGQNTPKTGAMPGVATGGYDAPSNAEAAAAYMGGFQARYDIPELDYPQEIKDRMRAARRQRLERDMNLQANRQKLMAKLALTVLAKKDPEAKRLLEELKDNPEVKPSKTALNQLFAISENQPEQTQLTKGERNDIYYGAIRRYKKNFRSLSVDACRWTEMRRLIGSGHAQMALIHGTHPTHGYKCEVELKVEARKTYPRLSNFSAFWVQTEAGDWTYYGKFYQVGVRPRTQALDANLLNNPEAVIMRQNSWDAIASSLN
jgi:hypothetical protein